MQQRDINDYAGQRAILRLSHGAVAFAAVSPDGSAPPYYSPYPMKGGVAVAANLRKAFKDGLVPGMGQKKAIVLVDSPSLLVPLEERDGRGNAELYNHAFTSSAALSVEEDVLPGLNAAALYGVDRDVKLVVGDHFSEVRYLHVMHTVWTYMHQRSFSGQGRKLYCYFHDRKMDLFSFSGNRFKYANCFPVAHSKDAAYYILYVWKELGLDGRADELCVAGEVDGKAAVVEELGRYVAKVYKISQRAEFNRAPITMAGDVPLDLSALIVRGL